MYQNSSIINAPKPDLAISICVGLAIASIYAAALFLHIKIIIVSKKEKDLTWKIDVAHSSLLLVLFAYRIFLDTISYSVEDLHFYTSEWICYPALFIVHYGLYYTSGHTMIIALLKYLIIVHDDKFRHRKETIKTIFFWVNLLYPIFQIAIQLLLVPDFYAEYGGWDTINTCLGKKNYTRTTFYSLCEFDVAPEQNLLEYSLILLRSTICKSQVVLLYMITFNLPDAFFYCSIFRHMKR